LRAEGIAEDGLERAVTDLSEASRGSARGSSDAGRRLPELSQANEVRLKQMLEARETAKRLERRARALVSSTPVLSPGGHLLFVRVERPDCVLA
jgi:hypothetical protein